MRHRPLDDLEIFELLQAAYPGNFDDEDDDAFDRAQDFFNEMEGDDLADFLGRVVMLTMPMESTISGELYHALGTFKNGYMVSAVRRKAV